MTLCRRVVIMLCLCDGVLHRTKRFVPDYRYTTALVGNRNADEVVVIDVTPAERRQEQRHLFYAALQRYAEQCFTPITVGGGIRTIEEIRFLMAECCADKVVIGFNSLDEAKIKDIAHKFGSQALTVAISHFEDGDLAYGNYCNDAEGTAGMLERFGAGEILLNSIPRDGSLLGYDLEALRRTAGYVGVPIMVAGGCGSAAHMLAAFEAGADAAATSNIFHITEAGMKGFKDYLVKHSAEHIHIMAAS